jgi:hypothetical protein
MAVEPTLNASYPLVLGETFLNDDANHSYCAMRYDFKPASASRSRPGAVLLLPEHGQVRSEDAKANVSRYHSGIQEDCSNFLIS